MITYKVAIPNCTASGKPQQNGFTESLNDKIRNECLNEHWFYNLAEAKAIINAWRDDYNNVRPHSSLNYLTPREFINQTQKGGKTINIKPSQDAACARLLTVAQSSSCLNANLTI